MVHVNINDVRFKIGGSRSKSNLSTKKKRRMLLSQSKLKTVIHKKKITRSQAQKNILVRIRENLC